MPAKKYTFSFFLAAVYVVRIFAQCAGTDEPCPASASTPSNLGTASTGAWCSASLCANGHGDGSGTTTGQSYSTAYGGEGKCSFLFDGTGNDIWFRFTMPASTDKVNMDILYSGCGTVTGRIMIYGPNPSCISYPASAFYCLTWTSSVGISDVITGLSGGATYHVRVLFEGTTCDNIDLCFYKAESSLPVEILTFNAFPYSEKEVRIEWVTASEENNDYFSIEHSVDGNNFSVVGTVKGAGNSSVQRKYSFTDTDPVAGTSYYRLKQTDFDGKFEIFSPVAVHFDPNNAEWIFVNPSVISSGKIQLELTNLSGGNSIEICLYDLQGNAVFSKTILLASHDNSIIASLALPRNIVSGLYALMVSCREKSGVKKIFVQSPR